jgi:hypothetical protein
MRSLLGRPAYFLPHCNLWPMAASRQARLLSSPLQPMADGGLTRTTTQIPSAADEPAVCCPWPVLPGSYDAHDSWVGSLVPEGRLRSVPTRGPLMPAALLQQLLRVFWRLNGVLYAATLFRATGWGRGCGCGGL